jgi:WD40 repeat protein
MSLELEHAIGCNVEFKNICHLHPNGKEYVQAVGGVVILGDLNNPHEQAFLQGHDDFITTLAVSNRGDLCATGQQGANANVILWDLASKRQVYCFEEQDHGIDCVCFSHDDQYLYACSNITDARIMVYGTYNGLIIAWAQLNPKPTINMVSGGFVRNIKRRDTHEYLSAACGGKSLVMWHLDPAQGELTCHPIGTAGKHVREYQCLAFTPDYEHLLAGTTSGDVATVLVKNRVVQAFKEVCSNGVTGLVCLPTGSSEMVRIVAGGGDGTVTILTGSSAMDLREERQIRLDGPVASVSLNSEATEVLAVCTTGSSWKVRSKDLAMKLHSQVASGAVYSVAYQRGISDMFLSCCGDGLVTLWDANDYSARVRCSTKTRAYPISAAGTEDIIVTGCSDGRLMSFDCAQGQNLWHIDNAHKGGATNVQLSSNMRFVLSGGAEGELRVWEVKSKEMMSHMKEHMSRVTDVKLFPNDEYAISASRDRCLLTWDLRSEKRLTAHREKHGGINCLAVASDQVTVFTAGQEKTLTTWDLRMADPVRTITLDEEVYSISISPDDRHLATAGTGLQVKIWDVAGGAERSRGIGHSRAVQKLDFSPDGKQLVSAGLDHSIMLWNFYT